MAEMTAEELMQRILDMRLAEPRQLEGIWTEFGTREVPTDEISTMLLNRQVVTNFQLDKLLKGDREGFFYGNYRVLYISGVGTFARVFRAVHEKTERVVALKVLRRRYRNEEEQVELFLREARMGERLRHDNIVRVFDVSNDIRAPYMVMEFVEGQTLREFMRARKKLDTETSLSLILDVVAGLDHALKRGITHRDMKLSNVLITSTGTAKLVDFGLATISEANDDLLTAAPNARSIDYVALERGSNVKKNDPRSDIYFAGCMFYHMLTGVAPLFETRDRLQRMSVSRFSEIKSITEIEPDVPLPLAAVVKRAMSFNPEGRYQQPGEMLADLNRAKYIMDKGEDATEAEEELARLKETKQKLEQEGRGLTVMFVESNHEMQDLLRDQLKKRGYRVLITSNPSRALQQFEDDLQVADFAVFSTQELGPSAVTAFNRLGELEMTENLPCILLVDQRHREMIESAQRNDHRLLLPMPLKIIDLRRALLKLLGKRNSNAAEQ